MVSKLLSHAVLQFLVITLVALGVAVCVFPSFIPSLSWVANYAVLVMLSFMAAGVLFLLLRQPRLTFVAFGGCLLLCFFLKFSVQNDQIERWRETVVRSRLSSANGNEKDNACKVLHLNISHASDAGRALAAIREANADLLSIHEVTPHWDQWLNDSLSALYPFRHTMVDIGIYGMAVFSKYELEQIDTFFYRDIPNLVGCLSLNTDKLCFASVHTEPAIHESSQQRLKEHLSRVARQVRNADVPMLVFGNFNAVSWSNELRIFRDNAGLLESRTGFMPYSSGGMTSFLEVPFEHIFYSPYLHCTGFKNLLCPGDSKSLGIMGVFQVKAPDSHAKKTAQ